MLSNELVWMVIAVYLPFCLSQLSSGSVAKIWQSVSVPAERGSKLDGNYGLGFFRMPSKKHGIRWFESEKGKGACHGHSRSLSGSVVVNSQFTPPLSQYPPWKTLFFSPSLICFFSVVMVGWRSDIMNLCNEKSILISKRLNLVSMPFHINHKP